MTPAHSVAELLNAAQDSRGEVAWARCAGQLWKLILQDPDPHNDELLDCVKLLLTVSQKSPHVQHIIKFLGSFASKAPEGSEIATAVMEGLLEHVARHTTAADKDVRFHACQLLHQLLTQLPASVLSDDAVLDTLTEALTERLSDKLPAIRAEAVRGLCSLISFFEDAQDIVDSVEALLDGDKSKDVRMAVVLSLPLDTDTLPVLLRRARDVSPQVRKALAVRLGELPIKVLSIKQRASILQQLLQDRDTSVAEAGRSMLEQHCGGDPLQLLQYLDVETYTDAAVCALESLINSNKLHVPGQQHASDSQPSAIAYVKAATAGGSGTGLVGLRSLCSKDGQLLEPQEALLWRCLCEWLQSDAISRGLAAAATAGARAAVQAAVAAERHEVLEAALPESADDMMGLIMRHTAAGPPARFAAAQLLTIAAKCMEWADVASRDSAAPFLQQLVALDPSKETDLAQMDLDSSAEDEEAPGLQLVGNGGDGLFEAAVVQLVAAMQGSTEGLLGAMLDGIADLAAAAGLLRKPAAGDVDEGAGQQQWSFTVGAADTSQVLQVLCYIRMLLQRLPMRQQAPSGACMCSISFDSLWELLLLLALKHDNTLVRAKALECIGLYAVVAAGSNPGLLTAAVSLLGPLLAAEGSDLVRAAAVRALADIALLYGPAAVDAVLRRPSAGAAGALGQDAASGDGEDGAEDGSSSGSNSSCKGLLELLLEQGQALLIEAQAGASKPARKVGRPSTKSKAVTDESVLSASAAELMAVVAESLAKLLLHQRAWLRHYPSYVPPADAHAANTADAAAAQPVQLPADSQQQQARLLQSALALLLQLQFHPATASLTEVCQRLSVFFDVFSAATEANQLQLAAACLPAARQALHLRTKKHPAPLLAKYVLQLLQQARLRREQALSDGAANRQGGAVSLLGETFTSVAHMLLEEVTTVWPFTVGAGKQPALYKPYLSSLLKAVFELPIESDPQCLAVLQNLTHGLSVLVSSSKDPTLAKDLTALQQHLQALADAAGGDADTLSEDSLQQLVQQYRKLSLEQLPALPDELAEAAAAAAAAVGDTVSTASTGAGRGAGRGGRTRGSSPAAKAPAGRGRGRGRPSAAGRKAAAAASSDDESSSSAAESDDDAGDSSSDSDAGVEAPAAASAGAAGRHDDAGDSSSDSDAGVEAPAAASAGAAGAAGRRSSAAAAGSSRRRSAAAAAVASDADSSAASEEGEEDSEEFATADESSGDEAEPSRGRAASGAAAAERAAGAGAVSEMSDSDADSDVDSDADSFCSDQEEVVRPAAGKRGVQVGKGAVAGSAGVHRQPLAPSAVVNRR